MLNVLIPVDGSTFSDRAVTQFIQHAAFFREVPKIQLLHVHAPIPVGRVQQHIDHETLAAYYREESEALLASAEALLNGAGLAFSRHIHVGPAVFWNLKDLEPGDLIRVQLADGTEYKYSVDFKQQFDAATAPVNDMVGPTPMEMVTLITCGGVFNSETHQYDKRLVVRAERIADATPAPALPTGTQSAARVR